MKFIGSTFLPVFNGEIAMLKTSLPTLAVILVLAACTPASDEAATQDASVEESAAAPMANAGDTSTELSCSYPVMASDTGASLLERYGDDAKLETLDGPEGTTLPGVVLWDGDDARAIEVGFDDEERTKLSLARVGGGSDWSVKGIKVGDTLAKVREVNGEPVKFYGFEWDFSGAVFGFGEGALDNLGGCGVQMSLTFDWDNAEYDTALSGDVEISSDDDNVDQNAISVVELGIGFPFSE